VLDKNVVIHGDHEAFPYHGVSLAVHILRLFSTLLGIGTLLLVYIIGRGIFPNSPIIYLGSTAIIAFLPQFVFLSSSINNDNLATFLATLVMLCLVRLSRGGIDRKFLLVLGLLLGLAAITKISTLGLLPLGVLVIFAVASRTQSYRFALEAVVIVALGFILVSGWWFVRNYQLYDDPLGLGAFLRSIDRPEAQFGFGGITEHASTFSASFLALFGWSNVMVDPMIYWFLGLVFTLGLLSSILYLSAIIKNGSLSDPTVAGIAVPLAILIAWLALNLLQLSLWASGAGFDVGRLLFLSAASISVLTVLGIVKLAGVRFSTPVVTGLLVTMIVVTAVTPILYIRPAYKQGIQFAAGERDLARPLNITFGDQIKLLSYEISREIVNPGSSATIILYWQVLPELRDELYRIGLVLASQDRASGLYTVNGLLTESNVTQRARKEGWLIRQRYDMEVPLQLETSSRLPIVVSVDDVSGGRLPAYDGAMRRVADQVLIFELKVEDGG
jgi:4-amino-4-deoxy-L-arabinose transferase-like glycosyltransferase